MSAMEEASEVQPEERTVRSLRSIGSGKGALWRKIRDKYLD